MLAKTRTVISDVGQPILDQGYVHLINSGHNLNVERLPQKFFDRPRTIVSAGRADIKGSPC